jgi:MFS superfamily sulfate permease-like transporter
VYSFFGSSLQLAVGPVAIVSLLMGSLVSQYGIVAESEESVEFASEVCLCMGSILVVLSILNVGNFIRYISFPVMSGFTSAAAALIGLNQVKSMFGFTYPGVNPATGLGSGYFLAEQHRPLSLGNNFYFGNYIVRGGGSATGFTRGWRKQTVRSLG